MLGRRNDFDPRIFSAHKPGEVYLNVHVISQDASGRAHTFCGAEQIESG